LSLIEMLLGKNSSIYSEFDKATEHNYIHCVQSGIAILESLIRQIELGLLNINDETPSKSNDISIAIISALYDDEFENLKEFFIEESSVDGFETLKIAKIKGTDKRILIDFQEKMGMVDASALSTQIIAKFPLKYLIMTGVCGGRYSKDVRLLDLVIPNKVFDYQTGKFDNGVFKPYSRSCSINNKKAVSAIDNIRASMKEFVSGAGLKKKVNDFKVHSRSMACGSVVIKTNDFLEMDISSLDEEVQAVEMESYGVARAAELYRSKNVTPLIIKGVMDYTEKDKTDKNKTEAAYFSACFMYFLIKDYLL